MGLEFKTTNVFARHRYYRDQLKSQGIDTPILVHQGGSRSSKTISILQSNILDAYEANLQNKPLEFTAARAKMTWMRKSVLKDFGWLLAQYGIPVNPQFNPRRDDQEYEIFNSRMSFIGLDDFMKLHGMSHGHLWVNEGIEVREQLFTQLEIRTADQITVDFNPIGVDSWCYDLQLRDESKVIVSTQLDNPFLPSGIRKRILGFNPDNPENVRRGTADKYYWDVYGLGKKAEQKGKVFKNVTYVKDFPEDCKWIIYGLDFGYTNDPTVLVKIGLHGGKIYVQDLIYETGLTNLPAPGSSDKDNIHTKLEEIGLDKRHDLIIADSAEPKSIKELSRAGWNIKGAEKGPDSIKNGIDAINRYPLVLVDPSAEMKKDFENYKYSEDKDGNLLNKPVDAFNHGPDATRYGATRRIKKRTKKMTSTI